MSKPSKQNIIDYIWIHSRYYGDLLSTCEVLYEQNFGYASLDLLFSVLEKIVKMVLEDYDISFCDALNNLRKEKILTEKEFFFLNSGNLSVRKIRNLLVHADHHSIAIEKNGVAYFLSENETHLMLYADLSNYIFHIIYKIVKRIDDRDI